MLEMLLYMTGQVEGVENQCLEEPQHSSAGTLWRGLIVMVLS